MWKYRYHVYRTKRGRTLEYVGTTITAFDPVDGSQTLRINGKEYVCRLDFPRDGWQDEWLVAVEY